MKKPIIIAGPHLNFNTGINYQLKTLIDVIKNNYKSEIIYCSTTSKTDLSKSFDFPVYNINNHDDFLRLIDLYNVEIVITTHDLPKVDKILIPRIQRPFYWIHYFMSEEDNFNLELMTTSEEGIYRGSLKNILDNIDLFIPATDTSLQSLLKLFNQYNNKSDSYISTGKIHSEVIHSFLNYNFSFDKEGRNTIRKGLKLEDKDFLFLVVARNFSRKNLPIYFQALSLLKSRYNSSFNNRFKLFLLSPPIGPIGYDLYYLKEYYDLNNNVILRDLSNYTQEFSFNMLNDLYCAADCLLSCSYAEGFGYPIYESLLCETPIIVSNVGSVSSYLKRDNIFINIIEPEYDFFNTGVNQRWKYTSPIELCNKMERIVHLKNKRNNNFTNLFKDKLDNKKTTKKWISILEKTNKLLSIGNI